MPTTTQISIANAAFGLTNYDLIKTVQATAQGLARLTYGAVSFGTLTDNSTGTAGASIVALTLPPSFVHVDGSDLAPKAGFDTAIGKVENVQAVLGEHLNLLFAKSGVGTLSYTGTIAASGTIPAMDKTLSGVDGTDTNAVEAVTGRAQLQGAIDSQAKLIRAYNILAANVGFDSLADNTGGSVTSSPFVLADLAATGSGVDGETATPSLANAAVGTLLTALANNYALLADKIDLLSAFLDSAPAISVAVMP